MWYKLNVEILAVLLLPTFLRRPKRIALVKSLVRPLVDLHENWLTFRENNLYKLEHTSQVCYFRKVLNDELDPIDRRIYIGDGLDFERDYIYTSSEQKPVYLGAKYIKRQFDFVDNAFDFTVFVPAGLYETNRYKLEYLIDYYKQATKRYRIELI